MLIKRPGKISANDITPESVYRARRLFMQGILGAGAMAAVPGSFARPAISAEDTTDAGPAWLRQQLGSTQPHTKEITDKLTPFEHVTSYNNFYEFGYNKSDPAARSEQFNPHPWQVEVAGLAGKTGTFDLEDLMRGLPLEERVYRLRCVEAWSMVIPWIGFELGALLKQLEPASEAKYVAFTTVHRPDEMPGQKSLFGSIDWPYVEGLRMDEAMHPLTLMAVGLYGKSLLNQNGAPLRLVVPWKYGFKSIKSIVEIEFTDKQPPTSWNLSAPGEYGFYANVNPKVDHPRWSQASERRLPGGLFSPNIIDTQPFNGYADEVASLYKGMDLRKYF